VGPSGSGKSTLLSILGCLDQRSTEGYLVDNQRVAALSRNRLGDLRNPRIGFVFQNFSLLPRLTVLGNVGLPLFYRREPLRHPAARSRAALEQVGLGARMHHMPTQASGAHTPAPGKKHRICVCPSRSRYGHTTAAPNLFGSFTTALGGTLIHSPCNNTR